MLSLYSENVMTIRKAMVADMDDIRRVYDTARKYMRENGNPSQWQGGYPPDSLLLSDIGKGELYVLADGGIHGVFAFIPGEDPTYGYIEGKWLRDTPYAAIHRIASDGTVRGLVASAVEYCSRAVGANVDLRIDTHEDNKTMQHVLEKNGFVRCGIIYLENGDPRIAYHRIG